MNCEVKYDGSGRKAEIRLSGELTIYTVGRVKGEMAGHMKEAGKIQVDLSGLKKIDSAGFQLLVLFRRDAIARNTGMSLVRPSEDVRQIFELYGESLA